MTNLKQCPYCKSQNIVERSWTDKWGAHGFELGCIDCGATVRTYSEQQRRDFWTVEDSEE